MSDNDVHDLALSGNNMDNTTNNNNTDEVVTGAEVMLAQANALLVELEAAPVSSEEEAAPVVTEEAVPVVTEEAALSDDSASGAVTEEAEADAAPVSSEEEEEGGDEDSLPSDHLEGSDTESQKDDTEETEGLRFRSFRADRAGSDTESDAPPPPAWPPIPTSPLRRQIGVTLSPVHGGMAGIGPDHIELVEAGPVVTGGDVPVPVWLFLAAIAVMLVYLTMVAYVMSWQCGVRH